MRRHSPSLLTSDLRLRRCMSLGYSSLGSFSWKFARSFGEIPAGKYRWLTVVSPEDGPQGTELSLEPNANPIGKAFQEGLFKQGIPCTAFEVDDIHAEHARLRAVTVEFTVAPTQTGAVWIAIFADTCGNLIQIYQKSASSA